MIFFGYYSDDSYAIFSCHVVIRNFILLNNLKNKQHFEMITFDGLSFFSGRFMIDGTCFLYKQADRQKSKK